LETRFLESLIAVAKYGSIAEAARRQGLTAAAVGQRIEALESELGFALLERVGHRSRPTQACERLLADAEAIVEQVSRLPDMADASGLSGTMRVGLISTVFGDTVPQLLRMATEQLPLLRLRLVPGTSKELYTAFNEGTLDMAIMVQPPFALPKEITLTTLIREPLVLIAQRDADKPIQYHASKHPYIRYAADSWGGLITERFLHDGHISLEPLCDLDSPETIAILVAEGMGFSLVPRWKGLSRFGSSISVSEPFGEEFDRHLCVITRTSVRHVAIVERLRHLIEAAARAPRR
jgi:DNA-binding transcriptional LysR family regulator